MQRIRIAHSYDEKWLESERPQPLIDNYIESLTAQVVKGGVFTDVTDQVYLDFKTEMTYWLSQSKLNTITGLDKFNRVDIINGCTQFIDNAYMQTRPQVIQGDYRYHNRLGNWDTPIGQLREGVPLVIAMPFPSTGAIHIQMKEILDEAQDKGISVHIDGAWLTCCRGIEFNMSHSAIRSVGISLSKGLGLGWNRVGLRWTKHTEPDSISIMNDFHMNLRAPVLIGLHFLRNLSPDYLWSVHGARYYKICQDFDLTPTQSIYLALRKGEPVGVSPLIRYLENASIS